MKKIVILATMLLAALAVESGVAGSKKKGRRKKVLIIIAPNNFRDEEFIDSRKVFEDAGLKVTVASTTKGTLTGTEGMKVKPDVRLKQAKAKSYDAIVFVGGWGAMELFDNADAHRLARNGVAKKKIVAAISIAPCILAKAGVLEDRQVTAHLGSRVIKILKDNGATVKAKKVVVDGCIVTGRGTLAAPDFARTVVAALGE